MKKLEKLKKASVKYYININGDAIITALKNVASMPYIYRTYGKLIANEYQKSKVYFRRTPHSAVIIRVETEEKFITKSLTIGKVVKYKEFKQIIDWMKEASEILGAIIKKHNKIKEEEIEIEI